MKKTIIASFNYLENRNKRNLLHYIVKLDNTYGLDINGKFRLSEFKTKYQKGVNSILTPEELTVFCSMTNVNLHLQIEKYIFPRLIK